MMSGYGIGGFGWFFMLIFWGGLIWLVIWLILRASRGGGVSRDPLTIAKERYAKGELTKKEYDEVRLELLK